MARAKQARGGSANSTPSLRDLYLETLNLPEPGTASPSQQAALSRAHELRKFEIENYWKRSNYFWLFQAAAITLTGIIYSHDPNDSLLLLSSGLGVITAQVGWLTARGSKFWQSNWEAHVDFLEPDLEGKLTQVVLYQNDAVRSSVSRVNERLYGTLLIAWFLMFANKVLLLLGIAIRVSDAFLGLGSAAMLGAAMAFLSIRTRSSLNPTEKKKLTLWDRFRRPAAKDHLTIFDRSTGVTIRQTPGDQPSLPKTS